MSWITHKSSIEVIAIISSLFLFGLTDKLINVSLMTPLLGTSITPAIVIGIGMIYIFAANYFKYV